MEGFSFFFLVEGFWKARILLLLLAGGKEGILCFSLLPN